MALLSLRDVHLGYAVTLLDGVDWALEAGERVALVGRNGAGKSTLLRLIAGDITPEAGKIIRMDGLRVAWLKQEVPQELQGSAFCAVAAGLGAVGVALGQSWQLHQQATHTQEQLQTLAHCQEIIETAHAWEQQAKIERLLAQLGLEPQAETTQLSGGLRRRVLLGQALVAQPDVLLLDEPTNHLDLEAIIWLENFLLSWPGALLFVTHDRMFLARLATRIVELDRGKLLDFACNYASYLERRAALLEAEVKQRADADKLLAQEEVWIRQGVKARRTRDMGRVGRLVALRQERAKRREQLGSVKLLAQQAERSGKLVLEAEGLHYALPGQVLLQPLNLTLLRGDKVGIIGPNGCGKTTLLRLLLGELTPTAGSVRLGTQLQIAYFDQYRAQLDLNQSVMANVAGVNDWVLINGQQVHIIGYLRDFLFTADRARQPVRSLSGGERNRLLLARLFAQPSNVLVLDEPTNDLDTDTLALLEELLVDYAGTVLLVSHDRAFLNQVVTSVLAFEGGGQVNEYVGGYDDWVRQRPATPVATSSMMNKALAAASNQATPKANKLSYKEQQELTRLPQRIETLEAELAGLHTAMQQPAFYQQAKPQMQQHQAKLAALETELATVYARWEQLEAR